MATSDSYSYLPNTVDIGGDIYSFGSTYPVNLAFKSRKQFQNTFGKNSETERLLRKYMNYSISSKKHLVFDTPEDKSELLKILKLRATALKSSKEFTSSTLKNAIFTQSYDNIIKLIQQLEGTSTSTNIKVEDKACATVKKEIKAIPEDAKFQMILEMAWYLLHPDKVPSEIRCDWAKLVKNLERLHVGDIVKQIRESQTNADVEPSKNALNYFKKINLQNVVKKDTIMNALDQAKQFATKIQDETATDSIKKRLESLLKILEMKKYLATGSPINEDGLKRSMITNPMKGGGPLAKPLGIAMNPLFDYFKVVYDPIYSFLEKNIQNYRTEKKEIIIPQLTTLLHISNNLEDKKYGVYRITNVDKELLEFIKFMINETKSHISKYNTDDKKSTFNRQIFKLPKVRLSSISDIAFSNATYKDHTTLPFIQFFIMGANINHLPNHIPNTDTDNAVKEFYTNDNIYMVYTDSKHIYENIPINVYDIDYSTIDDTTNIKIENLTNNYFNINKDSTFLEKILDITKYAAYNNTELALSIFIALKELMPK